MDEDHQECNKVRKEVLESLRYMDPGIESIIAQGRYFALVDDKSKINNYCDLVMRETKECQRMANAKLWVPLHAQTNLDALVDQLGLNWPKKAEENFRQIQNIFSEINETFEKRGLKSAEVPGVKRYEPKNNPVPKGDVSARQTNKATSSEIHNANEEYDPILDDERLKNIDKNIAQRILNEVVHKKATTTWDEIAGLENVKQAVNEIVVYPMQNPDLFQGLLSPAKGLLLFGPPGTGKTLIGKCIACESGATFFAISASSLTSKWVGEGEKMVRAMFAVARCLQPSVVFIDEIDSLLTQRVDGEHDSSRRLKTEFLVQFDGVSTSNDDRLLIIGATNRPQELDEAARRRFTKRIYIPLPDDKARCQIIKTQMSKGKSALLEDDLNFISNKTVGYSGADMTTLCKEAAMCAVRAIIRARGGAKNIAKDDMPPINRADFEMALKFVKASVSGNDLTVYEKWDEKYGASRELSDSSQI